MSTRDLIARSLDVTARTIDLVAVLSEATSSTSPYHQIFLEIGRWLGRENLNERELQVCLEQARDLVRPNFRSLQFYDAVLTGLPQRTVGPLLTQPSSALGRYLIKDPYLRWMPSTITCLFEGYDEKAVSEILCTLILKARFPGEKLAHSELNHHPLRFQIKPTIEKIINSVWFNVVNSKVLGKEEESLKLPDELRAICSVGGHTVETDLLGLALNELRAPPPQVIIESEHLVGTLTTWLFSHHNGRLRVIVGGKIIIDKSFGHSEKQIELRIKKSCNVEGTCTALEDDEGEFTMHTMVGNRLTKILSDKYSTVDVSLHPLVRQTLYTSPISYPPGIGKESILRLTRWTAQEIMRWLVNLHISSRKGSVHLAYKILHEKDSEARDELRVCDLLAQWPSFLNIEQGKLDGFAVVFSKATEPPLPEAGSNNKESGVELKATFDFSDGWPGQGFDMSKVLPHFPILRDMLEKVKINCICYWCRKEDQEESYRVLKGCLRYTAFLEVTTYLAHGIADAFGAPDVSAPNYFQPDSLVPGVLKILSEVAILERISWNLWLDTAARVFLGCPSIDCFSGSSDRAKELPEYSFHSATYQAPTAVALQYGDLAVIAPWLDISGPLSVRNSFGFVITRGRLGLAVDESLAHSHIQTVEGETVVIETAAFIDDTSDYVLRNRKTEITPGAEITIQPDRSIVQSDYMLVSAGSGYYRLYMRLLSNTHSRLLDASLPMRKMIQQPAIVTCSHNATRTLQCSHSGYILKLYEFDELLGRWWPKGTSGAHPSDSTERLGPLSAPRPDDPNRIFRITHVLDTYFKYNVAVALSLDDATLINRGSACLACTLERASYTDIDSCTAYGKRYPDRWIINIAKTLQAVRPKQDYVGTGSMTRKRLLA